ncbi:carboxypeptidase-like regulatory domain-containing protein [Fulvivirga sp. M361]|uniref:carboxypeptidase-like regulatory domain-containing protein n=1 Tax=Fulvivirga sp. M361 TaxID=2594266 RepID=UPI00117A7200|nr:carboxypeptidase-like regulatory domain-containing protein [Fulvivirga sp. M361]TRX47064.1 carboxypeptidase-like regulatory domain-containing protein [Fulvivirga sp. M361]
MKNIVIVLMVLGSPLFAQVENANVTVSLDSVHVEVLIHHLENNFSIRFYYDPDWFEEQIITVDFENGTLEELLENVFHTSEINFFIDGDHIFLTKGIPIQATPAIALSRMAAKEEPSVEQAPVEKGLIFTREYKAPVDENIENYTFEIGSRSKMVRDSDVTLAGYIRQQESQEPVSGAYIYTKNPVKGTTTDRDGFYSLTLPAGRQRVWVSSVTMQNTSRNLILFSDGKLDIEMEPDVISLSEIVVEGERDANLKSTQMGVNKIDVESTKNVPLVLGEKDITKIVTTLAGIQTLGEGAAGFNVRGGKSDQNLMLLNEATIYNASHFLGFFWYLTLMLFRVWRSIKAAFRHLLVAGWHLFLI